MGREPPPTCYAREGDLHIAYQVVGDGPLDLVLISEWHLPLDARWQEPTLARALDRLAGFSRLISRRRVDITWIIGGGPSGAFAHTSGMLRCGHPGCRAAGIRDAALQAICLSCVVSDR